MKGHLRPFFIFSAVLAALTIFSLPALAADPSAAPAEEVKVFLTGKFIIEDTCEAFVANSGDRYTLVKDEKLFAELKKTVDFQKKNFVIKGVVTEKAPSKPGEGVEPQKYLSVIDFKEEVFKTAPEGEKK